MSARNSAKAIVIYKDQILLNRSISRFGEYYALPGGGQLKGELLTETIRREHLEETGYTVSPIRLSGIYERITDGREDGMCHKIYFIFLCKLENVPCKVPTERDRFQLGMEWIDVNRIRTSNLFPRAIRDNIHCMMGYGETIFIGSERDR